MKKVLTSILVFFFAFLTNVLAIEVDVTSHHVVMYNMNDLEIIYEENKDEKVSIASLTKIMTTLVALENIQDLSQSVKIVASDFYGTEGYSEAGFRLGDAVSVMDLLYGIMLPSGADAVNAIVRIVAGDESKFVEMMNDKAKEIGLLQTSFANPVGKDHVDNFSTASDVAKLLQYALKNETFKKIFTTKYYKVSSNGLELKSTLSHYGMLDTSSILGSKSGFTKKAGRCLASISHLNGVDYLLVVINSSLDKNYNAVKDSLTLYNYYSSNYSYQQIIDKDKVYAEIPIVLSKDKTYEIEGGKDVFLYLENGMQDNLEYRFVGVDEVTKEIKKDELIGRLEVINGEDVLYFLDVYMNEDISYYHPVFWLIIAILIIGMFVRIGFRRKKKRRRRRKK